MNAGVTNLSIIFSIVLLYMPKESKEPSYDAAHRMDAMRIKALVEKPLPKIFGNVKQVHLIPADVKGLVGKR
jgi:hypothetical protein